MVKLRRAAEKTLAPLEIEHSRNSENCLVDCGQCRSRPVKAARWSSIGETGDVIVGLRLQPPTGQTAPARHGTQAGRFSDPVERWRSSAGRGGDENGLARADRPVTPSRKPLPRKISDRLAALLRASLKRSDKADSAGR